MAKSRKSSLENKIDEILFSEYLDSPEEKVGALNELLESYPYLGEDYLKIERAISSLQGVSGRPLGESLKIAAEMLNDND